MKETLDKVYEDTDILLGFVSFLEDLGISNMRQCDMENAARFYASYKADIASDDRPYYMQLAKSELMRPSAAVPSHYASRVRYMRARNR